MKLPPALGRYPLPQPHLGLLTFGGAIIVLPLAAAFWVNTLLYGGDWAFTLPFTAVAVLIIGRLASMISRRVTITDAGIESCSLGRRRQIAWDDVLILHARRSGRRHPRYTHVRIDATHRRRLRFHLPEDEHFKLPLIYRWCPAAFIIDESGPSVRRPRRDLAVPMNAELAAAARSVIRGTWMRTAGLVAMVGYLAVSLAASSLRSNHRLPARLTAGAIAVAMLVSIAATIRAARRHTRHILNAVALPDT